MKKRIYRVMVWIAVVLFFSCNNLEKTDPATMDAEATDNAGGQESVKDDESQKDIVKVALSSPDHSTLVNALKQAEYVNDLSNAGPFTVFAPTNAAFDKLPPGTLDRLMKKESKAELQHILEYHVSIGVFREDILQDGQTIGQASGDKITISKSSDGKIRVNGTANILAAIPASNGLIYVIDEVLLPPAGAK